MTVIQQVSSLDPSTREEVIHHWMAVNDADGAVGFSPGAPYDDVAAALDRHQEFVERGKGMLFLARDDEAGELVGLGWWIVGMTGGDHIATIKRLQVRPSRQGSGLGRELMEHMHSPGVLAQLDGVDFLHLQYRAGRGLGAWYSRFGYVEIARYDVWHKRDDGTYGGWAEMLRTRSGEPLPVPPPN